MTVATGPVALVTGGARRVGKAIVEDLAQRAYRVAIHYRTSANEANALVADLVSQGHTAAAFAADLADEKQVADLFAAIDQQYGQIDALVCCASTWLSRKLEATTAADLRGEFDSNTLSTYLSCREAGARMVSQATGGSIVTVADWALARPYLDHVAYYAAKGAIPALTRALAMELAHRNPKVRVNCVLPGPVLFPDTLSATERERIRDATLTKTAGDPSWLAHAVRFLLENQFVTGIALPVDGGRSIYSPGDAAGA